MYYAQVLRVSRGLTCLAIILAAIYAVIYVTAAANGAFNKPMTGKPIDDIPLPALLAISGMIAAFFASRYARSLSEENEAHLPVAWTKPVSRTRYALTVMAVDGLGIAAAFALVLFSMLAAIALVGAISFVAITPDSGLQFLRYLAFPLAYYGLITAVTASMSKAGRGFVFWAWLASFLLLLFSAIGLPRPWGTLVALLNYINPMTYGGYEHSSGNDTVSIMSGGAALVPALTTDFVALALLCLIGLAAGIWQWRKLEA